MELDVEVFIRDGCVIVWTPGGIVISERGGLAVVDDEVEVEELVDVTVVVTVKVTVVSCAVHEKASKTTRR